MSSKRKPEEPATAMTLRRAFNRALHNCEVRHEVTVPHDDFRRIWDGLVSQFSTLGYAKFSSDEHAPKDHLFPASVFESFEAMLDPWVKKIAEANSASAELPKLMAQRMVSSAHMKRYKDSPVNEDL